MISANTTIMNGPIANGLRASLRKRAENAKAISVSFKNGLILMDSENEGLQKGLISNCYLSFIVRIHNFIISHSP